MDAWRAHWAKQGGSLKTVDITAPLTYTMAPKSDLELSHVKKASQVTSEVFSKYLKEQIMDIVDNDKVRKRTCPGSCSSSTVVNLLLRRK
jgi:hypothetical protein